MRKWTLTELHEVADGFHRGMVQLDDTAARLEVRVRRLAAYGWCLPLWATLPQIALISRLRRRDADRLFLAHYNHQRRSALRQLTKDLRSAPRLRRWRTVIEQAHGAYSRRLFSIVVPSLLAVFEGALAEVTENISAKPNPKAHASSERSLAQRGLDQLPWASIETFTHKVFAPHPFTGRPPATLNRHWILHGRLSPSRAQTDSLKLFQAVHTVGIATILARQDMTRVLRDRELASILDISARG